MTSRCKILAAVLGQSASAIDDALLRALDLSDIDDQRELAETIVRNGRPRSLAGLIGRLGDLPGDVQRWLCEHAGRLADGLQLAISSNARKARHNAIRLISACRQPRLAAAVAAGLTDVDARLADDAAAALANCVMHYLQAPRPPRPGPDDTAAQRAARTEWAEGRKILLDAVGLGLASYHVHRRSGVLQCAVRLADELADDILVLLNEPANEVAAAMIDLVMQSVVLGGSAAAFYYLALKSSTTRTRFAGRIGALGERSLVIELIAQSYRSSDPEVAAGLAAVRQFAFFARPAWPEHVPDEHSAALVRFIRALGCEPAVRAGWLIALVIDGSFAQQQASIDALCRWNVPETTDALRMVICRSHDAELAERAADELNRRGCRDLTSLMRSRLNDPDDEVRGLAVHRVGQSTFERFWSQYPSLSAEARQAIAVKLSRVVPDLADRLIGRLGDEDSAVRLQALRVIDQAGLADELAEAIHYCCQDSDSRVRSAAVKLLGRGDDQQGGQLARAALGDVDARVRANAIEALEQRAEGEAVEALSDMLDDGDNRIRANAIKALMSMDLPAAGDSLQKMLNDRSAAHRLSALWVVEQVGWLKPAEMVLRLARTDPDRRVRHRALEALGELRRVYRVLRRRTDRPAGKHHAMAN